MSHLHLPDLFFLGGACRIPERCSFLKATLYNDRQMQKDNVRLHELESELQLVTENLEREMRARGFDPTQVENAALPTPLARLYLERQSLAEELEQVRRDSEQ